jgi:hypothetical protein
MLTIHNFKLLEGTLCGGWRIDSILDEVYKYDADLNIIEPKCYSFSFVSPLGMNRGKLLLTREYDEEYKNAYRYELWLNGKKFDTGAIIGSTLKNRESFIQSVVDTFDYELKNK